MQHALSGFLLTSVLIAASACGGSEGGGDSGADARATPADVRSACSGDCGFEQRCRGDTADPASCVDECLSGKLGTAARNMRSDAARTYGSCLESLECSGRDDDCEAAMYEAIGVNPEAARDLPDVRACLEKEAACPAMDDSFGTFCASQIVLVTSVRNAVMSCLDAPCEDIARCMARAFYGN